MRQLTAHATVQGMSVTHSDPGRTGPPTRDWKVTASWESDSHRLYARTSTGRVTIGFLINDRVAAHIAETHNSVLAPDPHGQPVTVQYATPDGSPAEAVFPPGLRPVLEVFTQDPPATQPPASAPPSRAGEVNGASPTAAVSAPPEAPDEQETPPSTVAPAAFKPPEPPPPATEAGGQPETPTSPPAQSATAAKRAQQKLNDDMRKWARRRGRKVNERGRIPADIVTDYLAAQRRSPGAQQS